MRFSMAWAITEFGFIELALSNPSLIRITICRSERTLGNDANVARDFAAASKIAVP
jgi:hypothetical protein